MLACGLVPRQSGVPGDGRADPLDRIPGSFVRAPNPPSLDVCTNIIVLSNHVVNVSTIPLVQCHRNVTRRDPAEEHQEENRANDEPAWEQQEQSPRLLILKRRGRTNFRGGGAAPGLNSPCPSAGASTLWLRSLRPPSIKRRLIASKFSRACLTSQFRRRRTSASSRPRYRWPTRPIDPKWVDARIANPRFGADGHHRDPISQDIIPPRIIVGVRAKGVSSEFRGGESTEGGSTNEFSYACQ